MDTIVWMDAPQEKAAVAEFILTRLPDWFGLPESTRATSRTAARCPLPPA